MGYFGEKVSFIWSVADLLRGPYRPNQYKDVMLPLTVLRRLDCVLEPTEDAVLACCEKTIPAPLLKAVLESPSERDGGAEICRDSKGDPEPDPGLRDNENVPLKEDVAAYLAREVLPHVPDAWVDESKTKIGYEINFNRYFYKYAPPRPVEEIEAELKAIEKEIAAMLVREAG